MMSNRCAACRSFRPVYFNRPTPAHFALTFFAATMVAAAAHADSVNSPNITMNVDTNRSAGPGAGGIAVTLNTITIAETMANEYFAGPTSAIILKARPGFQFDPTSSITAQSATIGLDREDVNVVVSLAPSGVADEMITITLTSGTSDGQDIIRINGVRLRILSAVGAAGPAQTTLSLTTSTAGGAFTDQGIVAAAITRGAPDRLVFAAQPGSTQLGGDLLPAVKMVDFGGNLVTDDVRIITLAIQTNPGAATLFGITGIETDAGIATWIDMDNLRIETVANGYTLRASHFGNPFLSSDTVDSDTFNISGGAPNRLEFSLDPTDTVAGGDILLTVTVRDQAGNVATGTPAIVTLDSAVNPGGWPLLVDTSLTKIAVGGVATWGAADHLRINKAITGYRLQASGVGAPIQTAPFDITAAPASSLQFVTQPSDTPVNVSIDPSVVIEVLDAFGNRTDSDEMVELILRSECGGTLTGQSAETNAGLATFDDLRVDVPCADAQLEAKLENLPRTDSEPFTVSALPAVALRFVQQPTTVEQDAPFNPPVTIELIDASGSRTGGTTAVQLTLLSSCGGALSTTSAAAIGGLATFAILSIDRPCTAVTLQATAAGLTGTTSTAFNVTAAPIVPLTLLFVRQPTTVEEGETINPPVTIEIVDSDGARTDSNATIELTLLSACGGTLSTTSVDAVDGLATLDDLSIDTPCAAVMLRATSAGLTPATSDIFGVTMAPNMEMPNGQGCGACGQGGAMAMIPILLLVIGLKLQLANQRHQ